MKKWIPWLLAVLVIFLLVVRLFYRHVNRLKSEKSWYISELHYNFSGRIDTVMRPGRVRITVTQGELDAQREWKLKKELHAHGMLHLVIFREQAIDILVPRQALKNDSLHVDSDKNKLSLYRDGQLLITRPLSESLRQRPF